MRQVGYSLEIWRDARSPEYNYLEGLRRDRRGPNRSTKAKLKTDDEDNYYPITKTKDTIHYFLARTHIRL